MNKKRILIACMSFIFSAGIFAQQPPDTTVSNNPIFQKVEKESQFPGGTNGWREFLMTHLVYPPKALRKHIQGTVTLQFIVDINGDLLDIEAVSGDPSLRKAALNVIRQSPRWIPAEQGGKKVKSYKKQPIVFRTQ